MSENSPKSVRIAMVANQLEYINMELVKEQLNNRECIKDWAYIIHDKDIKENGEPVAPHVHIIMRFKGPQQLKYIGNWFEQKEQYVEAWKGGWTTACRYLTHANDESKHQYDNSEVIANFDYDKQKENIKPKRQSKAEREREIVNLILDGKIKRHNIYLKETDDLVDRDEAVLYSAKIKQAFENRSKELIKEEKKRGEPMKVIYVFGKAGAGKTTYAHRICENMKYSYAISGASNDPLQDYEGQDCLVLDDYRADDQKAADILKMLDNNTASSVKSRYSNKSLAECKMIIITSVLPLEEWWERVSMSHKEPIEQFKRRVNYIYEVNAETVDIYGNMGDEFKLLKTAENKALEFVKQNKKSREDMINEVSLMIA